MSLRRIARTDPANGEERLGRVTPPAVRLLRADPLAALVRALENLDKTTQAATPAGCSVFGCSAWWADYSVTAPG